MSAAGHLALTFLGAALFALGLFGVLARRSTLFQLIALEVTLMGPALVFVAAGARHGGPEGQGMFVLVLSLAAAEVGVGLALFLRLRRLHGDSDSDALRDMRG